MRIILFEQWDKLVAMFKSMASNVAADKSQYSLNRVMPVDGRADLADRAMNTLTITDQTVTLQMPDMIPGKARDFLLKVKADGECVLDFGGETTFEGETGSLDAPLDGECVIYFFTETEADVFLVARKNVKPIEQE